MSLRCLLARILYRDARILAAIANLEITMSAASDKIDVLKADVAQLTSVKASVETFVASVPQMIADAVAQAKAANPDVDLSSLDDLHTSLSADITGIAAAVTANTPAAAAAPVDPAAAPGA